MIKIMVRMLVVGLLLWPPMLTLSLAGQITGISVGGEAQNEIEIFIEGEYESYRAFGLPSPARFVIDLEKAQIKPDLPLPIEVKSSIVSGIRASQRDSSLRVILDSANKDELFHCTIQDNEEGLSIKCWMPVKTQKSPVRNSKAYQNEKALSPKDLSSLFGWPDEKREQVEKKEEKQIVKYTGEKITLDFYKTDLHNVFRLFAEVSGKNIIVDDEVKGELTLALKAVPWDSALDFILEVKGLTKEEKHNTFVIRPRSEKAKDGMEGELVVRKFSEDILQPARLIKREKENLRRSQEIVLQAYNLENQGKREDALILYEKAFNLQKDNIDLLKKMTYLNYLSGNFAKSYYFAGEALKLNAKDADAALYGALAAVRMEKWDAARLLFKVATEEAIPLIPEAFYNYGLFLERQKDHEKAIYTYKRYESLFGPAPEVSLAIARLYEEENAIKQACKKYREIQFSGFSMDQDSLNLVRKKVETLCTQGRK